MVNSIKFLSRERTNINHMNYYYFVNAFTNDELNKIIEICESYPKEKGQTGAGDDGKITDYRISDISWIEENEETFWIYSKIADYAISANKEMWNFDIWGYYDNLQYTTYYGNGGHYDWHADLGPNMSNRKLSVVLQLSDSDEYVGGDLQMNFGHEISSVPRQKGLICFFPSFVLHRVSPLISGERRSLVTWLCGSNLR